MFKLLKLFFWLTLTLVVLGGLDQFLVRVPLDTPGVAQVQTFYVDFRSRLLSMVGVDFVVAPAPSIEQVIEASASPSPQAPVAKRYLYADDAGMLQFADSLQQVPARYRKDAQPLAE